MLTRGEGRRRGKAGGACGPRASRGAAAVTPRMALFGHRLPRADPCYAALGETDGVRFRRIKRRRGRHSTRGRVDGLPSVVGLVAAAERARHIGSRCRRHVRGLRGWAPSVRCGRRRCPRWLARSGRPRGRGAERHGRRCVRWGRARRNLRSRRRSRGWRRQRGWRRGRRSRRCLGRFRWGRRRWSRRGRARRFECRFGRPRGFGRRGRSRRRRHRGKRRQARRDGRQRGHRLGGDGVVRLRWHGPERRLGRPVHRGGRGPVDSGRVRRAVRVGRQRRRRRWRDRGGRARHRWSCRCLGWTGRPSGPRRPRRPR